METNRYEIADLTEKEKLMLKEANEVIRLSKIYGFIDDTVCDSGKINQELIIAPINY